MRSPAVVRGAIRRSDGVIGVMIRDSDGLSGMAALVHHIQSLRPRTDLDPLVAVLDEMVGMLDEFGLPAWANALGAESAHLIAGETAALGRIRGLLTDPEGLRIVRVAFGELALISRWVELCDRLEEQMASRSGSAAAGTRAGEERWAAVLPFRRRR
jgi:hypothetical protein